MEHFVNPVTDRCVRCGRNSFNRANQPKCMTTGDYVEKWACEENATPLPPTRWPEDAEL